MPQITRKGITAALLVGGAAMMAGLLPLVFQQAPEAEALASVAPEVLSVADRTADADPFLRTWNTGPRRAGRIPYAAEDAYFTDNYHDLAGFPAFLDGSTESFYGGNVHLPGPSTVRLDLRKYRARLDKIRVFVRGMQGPLFFFYVAKGSFTPTPFGEVQDTGWQELPLPQAQDVTWLELRNSANGDYPSELELYGSYVPPAPVPHPRRRPAFEQVSWVNAFEWNVLEYANHPAPAKLEILGQHGGMRHYLDRVHLEPAQGDYYFAPSFNGAGSWDYDAMYQALHRAGLDVRTCIKAVPDWLQATWPPALRKSEQLPVEYAGDQATTQARAYEPASYLAEGKLFFQFAARYGRTAVAPARLRVHTETNGKFPHNVPRTGLGWVTRVEVSNEPDSWWHGWQGCMFGGMMAARMSCAYDGHRGALGPDVGVKAADPRTSVSFPGLAVANTEALRAAVDWCREHRGYLPGGAVDLPWDCINYHQYSNSGGSVQNGQSTARGQAPEASKYDQNMQAFLDYADEHQGGRPVILGEYGFDVAQFSDQRAVRPIDLGRETTDRTTRKLVQGQWMLRSALLGWVRGLAEMQVYMLDDVSDSDYGHYASGGLVDAQGRRPAAFFFHQALRLLRGFKVEKVLSTAPYVVRARNAAGRTAYVLWSPTETGATGRFALALPQGGTRYELSPLGLSPVATALPAGTVPVPLSETPCIVLAGGPAASPPH